MTKINGATELAGDSAEDFAQNPDRGDVLAEQMSEEAEAFQEVI